mgnify:CR=1 FL=1
MPTTEKDLTEVMLDLLAEIRNLSAQIHELAAAVKDPPSRAGDPIRDTADRPWFQRAHAFLRSPEAEALAARRELTADAVTKAAGLDLVSIGHRRYVGKLMRAAGYTRFTEGDVHAYYRRLGGQ